jgi:hypothetical protein
MKTYSVKLEVNLEVEAFNIDDATEYVHDIFNLDDEIKSIKIISIKE